MNEEVFANLAEAHTLIERWSQDYNQIRPHSAHAALTPAEARLRHAGDRLRNPDQLRRSPAFIRASETAISSLDSHSH